MATTTEFQQSFKSIQSKLKVIKPVLSMLPVMGVNTEELNHLPTKLIGLLDTWITDQQNQNQLNDENSFTIISRNPSANRIYLGIVKAEPDENGRYYITEASRPINLTGLAEQLKIIEIITKISEIKEAPESMEQLINHLKA